MIKSIFPLMVLQIIGSLIFPWWIIVLISLIYSALWEFESLWRCILVSFLAGLIVYSLGAAYSELGAERSASALIGDMLGNLPYIVSYLITGLIGAIASTFGGITGYLASKLFLDK